MDNAEAARRQKRCEAQRRHMAKKKRLGITCTVEGCDNVLTSKGMCNKHYQAHRYATDEAFREMKKAGARKWNDAHPRRYLDRKRRRIVALLEKFNGTD